MSPSGYTRTQIVLHWLVAVLILPQFLFHDPIAAAWHAHLRGEPVQVGGTVWVHIAIGLAIGAFVVWRMAIKARRGAPALPDNEPAILKLASNLTHLGLYALLLLLVLSGLAGWFADVRIAIEAHEVLKTLLLALIVLHVLGALYQSVVLRSDVMARMVRPRD